MATYTQSHPWLTFKFPWSQVPPQVWLMLGEAQSRCKEFAGVPLRPEVASELSQVYLAKGALATAAIEGNTLTEQDVRAHLAGKLKLPESKQYLQQEIRNILRAANLIFDAAEESGSDQITVEQLKEFNRLVLTDLPLPDHVIPGELTTRRLVVGPHRGVAADECGQALQEMCTFLNNFPTSSMEGVGAPDSKIATAIMKATVAHLYLVWIHPFGDGNGRTARLIELMILSCAGVAMPASHLMSDHYNQTRMVYYQELNKASQNGGNILPFIEYTLRGFLDGLREQGARVRAEQWRTAWSNHVHEQFKNKNTKAAVRQRHLILDISDRIGPTDEVDVIHRADLRDLSPRLAVAYDGVGSRMISRDINALEKMGLLVVGPEGFISPRYSSLLGFSQRRRIEDGEHPI